MLRKCALSAGLAVAACVAWAAPASAVQVDGCGEGCTFATGGVQWNSFWDISCASASMTVTIPEGSMNPSLAPMTLAFDGCTGPGGTATATCGAGYAWSVSGTAPTPFVSLAMPVYQASPLRGCRFDTATGCEFRYRASSGNTAISGTLTDQGVNPGRLVTNATAWSFTTSGGFACLFVSSGSSTIEAAGGGNITWTEVGNDLVLS